MTRDQTRDRSRDHPTTASDLRTWGLRATSWVLLGSWLGSWSLFAFAVAPLAFQVYPGQGEAGALVGPLLADLHNLGIVAGLGVALANFISGRRWPLWVAPLVLAGLCGVSEYALTPAIHEVQPLSFGPAVEQEAARRFSDLHQVSRYLFGGVLLGVLALMLAQAWPERTAQT